MDESKMLKALGEPMRFKIFTCLLERKHCVRSLSKKLGISESAISQHLKIMKEADLVYGEKFGYHTHFLPKQDSLDVLVNLFTTMQSKSIALDCDMSVCQCEFKKEAKE